MATNLLWLDGTNARTETASGVRSFLSLNNVENTALSTWTGSTNITTVGTIATGTWQGSVIGPAYLGTGTRDGTKFLRDDGTWVAVAAGGFTWNTITNANVNPAVTRNGYIMETGGTLRTVTLPANAPAGFVTTVNANAGQVRIVSNGNVIDGVGAGNDLTLGDGNTVTLVAKATGSLEIIAGGTSQAAGIPAGGTTGQALLKTSNTDFDASWQTLTKTTVGLANVENTALSTWAGSANITTVGTIATGTWNGTNIADNKIASALTGKTYNGLTLTAAANGFTIAGGTTPATLTVASNGSVSGTNTGDQFTSIATASFLGRNTAGTGAAEVLTAATAKNMLGLVKADVGLGNVENTALSTWTGSTNITTLGTVATGTWQGSVIGPAYLATGTRDGTKFLRDDGTWQTVSAGATYTFGGGLTESGGAVSIASGGVTLAQMASLAANSIIGNNTGSAATPLALTTAQVRTMLSINNVENTALSAWAGSANITTVGTIATGTWNATNIADNKIASALTGKTYNGLTLTAAANGFTIAGGTTSATLTVAASGSVTGTNTGDQFTSIATSSVLGRATAGTGAAEVLTIDQLRTLLGPTGTPSATTYLRGDGSWATPAGGSGGTPGGTNGQIQFNNAGAFGGAAYAQIGPAGHLVIYGSPDSTPPPAGAFKIDTTPMGGRILPQIRDISSGSTLQPHFGRNAVAMWQSAGGLTTFNFWGAASATLTATGTATAQTISINNRYTETGGVEALVTTAAATAIAGFRTPQNRWFRGSSGTDKGGFHVVTQIGFSTGLSNANRRFFIGMSGVAAGTAPTDVNPTSQVNTIGWHFQGGTTSFFSTNASGTISNHTSTGSITLPSADRTTVYEFMMYSPPGSNMIYMSLTNLNDFSEITTSFDASAVNAPLASVLLGFRTWHSAGGTSSVIGLKMNKLYIETDY